MIKSDPNDLVGPTLAKQNGCFSFSFFVGVGGGEGGS